MSRRNFRTPERSGHRSIWRLIFWIAITALIVCAAAVGWYYYQLYQNQKIYEQAREEAVVSGEGAEGIAGIAGGGAAPASPILYANEEEAQAALEEILSQPFEGIIDAEETRVPADVLTQAENNPVNFVRLQEINPELYAWIRIPNTQIDYPVAQHQGSEPGDDQNFYLHHDMYGQPQYAGCIYSQDSNSTGFDDPVTVLYGHNMKNGSMFQNLYYFIQDESFFNDNKYVYIYTPDCTRIYEIYSAYFTDDRNIVNTNDFSKKKVLEQYIEESQHPRSMEARTRSDVRVTSDDHILTLSTCIAGQTDQRYVVQSVLIYEGNGESGQTDAA